MKELLPTLTAWTKDHKPFAMAHVIQSWGSSPRPMGSTMLISKDLEMAGSVSGGCVEGAVVKAAESIIETGVSKKLAYGVTDEDAWAVGLSCGGRMQVFAERCMAFSEDETEKEIWAKIMKGMEENQGMVLLSKLEESKGQHTLIHQNGEILGEVLPGSLIETAKLSLKQRKHALITDGDSSYFVRIFPRKSQLLIIGAAHISADLITLANQFNFETIVIDPRGAFADRTQFPSPPDQVLNAYPSEVLHNFDLDAFTYAVVLSHDPKIDDNALHILLASEVGYIGALGSKKTHAKRIARLTEAGFLADKIAKIHAPIGVDIRAKSPQEIALAIMGEIIQVKNAFL